MKASPSLVKIVKVNTDKTASRCKTNATVPYPVHLVPLNVLKRFCRILIDHGYTLVALLPVSTSDTADFEDRDAALK